jgi:alpha-ketoglutarate-dependent taurine dioxygenase
MHATFKALQAAVDRFGWAVTEVDTTANLVVLAESFGEITPSRVGAPSVDELRPKPSSDASHRSLSGAHGLGAFPYHTDAAHHTLPPRFVFLRLASHTPTLRRTLVAPMPRRLRKSDREILEHDVWLVDGGRGRFLTSILGSVDGAETPLVRFDEGCMRPADPTFGAGRETIHRLTSFYEQAIDWVPGRTVVLDNWRTLHARSGFAAPDETRVLERVLVKGL